MVPAAPFVARSQAYPIRPVHIIVGFAAGGTQDIIARIIGQWLSTRLGQSFVVDNRPGAGGNIAADVVAHAAADGYTLLMIGQPNAVNASLYDNLSFNFIRDIAPIASAIRVAQVIAVNPSFPAKTVPDFIAYAKANPGKVSMASSGTGTPPHIAGELFKMMAGVDLLHVPYRGGGPALIDLIGGQVQVYFGSMPETIQYVRSGKVRVLAVTTAKRSEVLPDLSTVGDFVAGYEASSWYGVGAPKGTADALVDRLNKEIRAALVDSEMVARLADLGGTVLSGSPADFVTLVADETDKWGKVIRAANIKAGQ